MAIYDNFPYTNIHEMNLAWIIEQVKQGNLTIADFAEQLAQFDEDYATLSALAAAFTIAGSNISTTKNFSAASLTGPLTGNVTGNLTGNVTGNVTGDVTGDLTGNVTGNVTGDVTGDLTGNVTGNVTGDVTGDLTGNVTGNVTGDVTGNADTATTATNATSASYATSARQVIKTDNASTDLNDYYNTDAMLTIFTCAQANSNAPTGFDTDSCIVVYIGLPGIKHGLQFAWFHQVSNDIYYRLCYGTFWQTWYQITKTLV